MILGIMGQSVDNVFKFFFFLICENFPSLMPGPYGIVFKLLVLSVQTRNVSNYNYMLKLQAGMNWSSRLHARRGEQSRSCLRSVITALNLYVLDAARVIRTSPTVSPMWR